MNPTRLAQTLTFLFLSALLSACSGSPDPLSSPNGWTFVNYWAQWCKPCIKEIPELNALHGQEGYTVLGVNFDGATGEDLAAQLEALGVEFPTLDQDPAQRLGTERPVVLPTTLVLAPGGEVRGVLVGPQTQESLIAATRTATGSAAAATAQSG